MTKEKQIKKLITFSEDNNLAIFDELQELNNNIQEVINTIKGSKQTGISIDNPDDIKTDLSPLEVNFEALRESINAVKDSIQSKKDVDMSGIEKILLKISNKENKEIDISELSNISEILDNILYAVQITASATKLEPEKKEVLIPDLKKIQKVLDIINNSVKSLDFPEFDYDKLALIIKKNLNIKVSAGGSGGSVNLRNASDTTINPATSEKQDSIITAIQAIPAGGDATSYALKYDEGATYTYIGNAVPGTATSSALWRIKRLTNADNTIVWADGNANFDNIYDNRATLSYS